MAKVVDLGPTMKARELKGVDIELSDVEREGDALTLVFGLFDKPGPESAYRWKLRLSVQESDRLRAKIGAIS